MRLKNALFPAFLVLLMGMLAACGSSSSTPVIGATPVSAPVASRATVKALSSPSSSSSSVIVATGLVDGFPNPVPKVMVLTTLQGMTLYIHERRGASSFDCTGTCAQDWHPLIFTGSGRPASTTPLPGTLSLDTDVQGRRVVVYQGYPLFTYRGDTAPGQVKGRGAGDSSWQVADITLSPGL